MKKLAIAFSMLSFTAIFAQKVSDYQYIVIADKFEGFKDSNYGLDKALTKSLNSKKYTVLSSNRNEWPAAAQQNPCSVLVAEVENDSGMLRNKVLVKFRDCNNKEIATQKGGSSIKEFEEGFQDALKQAMTAVPASNPIENSVVQSPAGNNSVPEMMTKEVVSEDTGSVSGAEMYTNQGIKFQKVKLSAEQFILTDQSSSPFATFTATTKKDVYRVKFRSGQLSIAYFENGNLIVEMPLSGESYLKQVFSKN
ncbi:hypothetical protein ASG31_13580 [Chryseobacterium sp. Leaf404]|uniref:hypothetical protein n=1 Tax=unclassified Chryseobacterium TaxID=2593645 RepID=UPI0007004180|nr:MULTISPECIES: hypothetical protein [unclassified Chryseobacterium]KQT16004.1 hypothetical protein ASG31_13580 [Chryseobacterium sp. Leaf404]